MEEKEIIEVAGVLKSYRMKGMFDVELNFDFTEDQLANALQFMATIGKQIRLIAKIDQNSFKLGTFIFNSFKVDRDANSSLKLKSTKENCYMENLPSLATEEGKFVVLRAKIIEGEN